MCDFLAKSNLNVLLIIKLFDLNNNNIRNMIIDVFLSDSKHFVVKVT